MLKLSEYPVVQPHPAEAQSHVDVSPINRLLSAGEVVFRQGDARDHIYRVERGTVCLYREDAQGVREVIEHASPGDYVGLGYLDHHVCSAAATCEAVLSCYPRPHLVPALTHSPTSRVKTAMDPEIAFSRGEEARTEQADPITRAAALFVTLSRCNAYEGRDPTLIADSLTCGLVAGYLDMSVDDLARVLKALEAHDLVENAAGGLRLKDLDALEKLAEGSGRDGSAPL